MNANRTNRFAIAFAACTIGLLPIAAASAEPTTGNSARLQKKSEAVPTKAQADFDASGKVEIQDFFRYFDAWSRRDPGTDMDGDKLITLNDLYDFLAMWMQALSKSSAAVGL